MYAGSLAVLKTDTRMSAKKPMEHPLAEPGLVAYVMVNKNSKVKIVTSWGHLGAALEIGGMVTLVGDQSGRNLGVHTVYGIIDLTTGVTYWMKGASHLFPNTYPHYVVK